MESLRTKKKWKWKSKKSNQKGILDSTGWLWLEGLLICDRRELGIEIDSMLACIYIEWVNEAARRKCERKRVFCSHDPFSVNREPQSLKRVPNERSLCLLPRSLSSGSNSSRFIASRSAAFSDHHDFIFVRWVFLLMALFRHTRDISLGRTKSVTD